MGQTKVFPTGQTSHWLGWFPLRMTVGNSVPGMTGMWFFPVGRALQPAARNGPLAPFWLANLGRARLSAANKEVGALRGTPAKPVCPLPLKRTEMS